MRTLEAKREADRKYYASRKGRINRWMKGDLDARDDRLRALARKHKLHVTFTTVDTVVLRETAYQGDVKGAIEWLRTI